MMFDEVIEQEEASGGAKQLRSCSAIHLTFQCLQPIDVTFDRPIAEGLHQGIMHSEQIAPQSLCEPLKGVDTGVFCLPCPVIECFRLAALQDATELYNQTPHESEARARPFQTIDLLLLLCSEKRARFDQKGSRGSRERTDSLTTKITSNK